MGMDLSYFATIYIEHLHVKGVSLDSISIL